MSSVEGADRLIAKFETAPRVVHVELFKTMQAIGYDLDNYVKTAKLSGAVLKVKTGQLRSSVHNETSDSGDTITTKVGVDGSRVPYARIHEYGGKTAPHDILPQRAMALAFVIGGRQIFAKRVHHPGSTIPERSYLRTSLAEKRPDYMARISSVVKASFE